jgi:hypothetical protein
MKMLLTVDYREIPIACHLSVGRTCPPENVVLGQTSMSSIILQPARQIVPPVCHRCGTYFS